MTTMELINKPTSQGALVPRTLVRQELSAELRTTVRLSGGTMPDLRIADDRTSFEREQAAFELLRPTLERYRGQFVAIHNGQLRDFDLSRNALVRRFFRAHGEGASLYVGYIGSQPAVRVPTPLFRRAR